MRFLVASAQQRTPRRPRVLIFMFLSKRIPICCSDVDHSAGIIRFDVGFPGFGLAKTFGQGRPMSLYSLLARKASSFSLFSDSMLQDESLPLADVIDGGLFKQAFKEFDIDFGSDDDAVYTPALVLWALISQAFFKGEQRSLTAAVTRIAAWWATGGRTVSDTNTGAYSRARMKIPAELIAWIVRRIAKLAESSVDLAEPIVAEQAEEMMMQTTIGEVRSQPIQGRVLLVDGFTVDAADTLENQAEYPQNPAQEEGLGFPILRCVSLISMATGMLFDLAIGPYCGKETGETALLRKLLDNLRPGDVLVADSYYCTYWLLAMCKARDVDVVMKNHHKREDDPEDAKRICKGQRKVIWKLPQRPDWMSIEQYQRMPESIEIRLVDVEVQQPGFRSESFTVATTILSHRIYTADWIASAYRVRWLVELDIRSIKCSLGMETLRAKTPEMVRAELWSCLLAYNLIRLKMLQSGIDGSRDPRSMSFSRTMVLLGTTWVLCGARGINESLVTLGKNQPLDELVGHRPDRVEPRVNKRRPKILKLMTQPRRDFQASIGSAA